MRIRWTEPAARDLTQITDYLEKHGSSATARRIALSISERIGGLTQFPEQGRTGRKSGTRARSNRFAIPRRLPPRRSLDRNSSYSARSPNVAV